jgi:hypothetical protein
MRSPFEFRVEPHTKDPDSGGRGDSDIVELDRGSEVELRSRASEVD